MKFQFTHKLGRTESAPQVFVAENTEDALDRIIRELHKSEFGPNLGIGESVKLERTA